MSKIEIKHQSQSFTFIVPEKWDELSAAQFAAVIDFTSSPVSAQAIRVFLRRMFSPEVKSMFDNLLESELYVILEVFRMLLDNPMYTESKLPKYRLWRGPDDCFQGLVWAQYGLAEEQLIEFLNNGADDDASELARKKALNTLWGVLYTPLGLRFNHRLADVWIFFARMVPKRIKLRALYNFHAIRRWVISFYPLTFSGGGDSNARDFGMLGLNVSLSGTKFGKRRELELTPMHDVLIHLEQKAEHVESSKNK